MRKLLYIALPFCAALTAAVLLLPERKLTLLLAAGLLLLFPAAFLSGSRRLRRLSLCLLAGAVGLLWFLGYRSLVYDRAARFDGAELQTEALVLDAPMQSVYGWSAAAELRLDGRSYQTVLYLPDTDTNSLPTRDLLPGDQIRCTVRLKLTPGQIRGDENHYYRSRGIWFTASCVSHPEYVIPARRSLRHCPTLAVLALQRSLRRVFPEDTSGFLTALLTGDREGLSFETRNDLSVSGIYHTVALSGMHISIVIGMILLLCGSNKRLGSCICIPAVIFFVLMAGAPASAVRAAVMQVLLLFAPLLDRENDPFTSLGGALMLLLLIDPWSVYNVGLQLSFVSTAGILFFSPRLYEKLCAGLKIQRLLDRGTLLSRFAQASLAAVCSTLSAMVFSLPLSALYFRNVSLVSPLVNALTLWAVTICFVGGMACGLLGLLWAPLAAVPAWLLSWLARYVLGIAKLFARLPFASVYLNTPYMSAWSLLLYGAVLLHLCLPREPSRRVTALCLTASLLLSVGLSYLDEARAAFSLTALDVGQGQSILFRSGDFTAVIDCGGTSPQRAGENMARYLQSTGVLRPQALILTHYDADHCGGAGQLLCRSKVGTLFLPLCDPSDPTRLELAETARTAGTAVQAVDRDVTLEFQGGSLTIFGPMNQEGGNDGGLCVLISHGAYDILITGDLTADGELELLRQHTLPDIELLVAGHHGAGTSTSYGLLQRTRPETALISVAENNHYGHPAPETLERLRLYDIDVFRTDRCGTITIRGN